MARPAWIGNAFSVFAGLGFAGYVAWDLHMLDEFLANLPLQGLDTKATFELTSTPGTRLSFGLSCDSYRYHGENYVLVDVELLRGSDVVAHLDGCRTMDFTEASGGSGTDATSFNNDCKLIVPETGFTRIRVGARREYQGTVDVEKLRVIVTRPRW